MPASHYPTLHLRDLDGRLVAPGSEGPVSTEMMRIAVIPHPTLGHVALIREDPPGHFVTRFLSREEAERFTTPLLCGDDRRQFAV